jgi:hypothetical protein
MRPIALALLAFGGGVAGGVVSSEAVKPASAEAAAITIPVPAEGVVFRSPAGRTVARLRSEAAGGVFELFDARERVSVRLRAAAGSGVVELGRTVVLGAAPPASARSSDDSGY